MATSRTLHGSAASRRASALAGLDERSGASSSDVVVSAEEWLLGSAGSDADLPYFGVGLCEARGQDATPEHGPHGVGSFPNEDERDRRSWSWPPLTLSTCERSEIRMAAVNSFSVKYFGERGVSNKSLSGESQRGGPWQGQIQVGINMLGGASHRRPPQDPIRRNSRLPRLN